MNLRSSFVPVPLAVFLFCACGSSSSSVSPEGGVEPSVDGGSADAASDGGPALDSGGRVADFNYSAVCVESWNAYDLAKSVRFAAELTRGTHPNKEAFLTLKLTPLRATAATLESKETVGPTFVVLEASIGGYDHVQSNSFGGDDRLQVPGEASDDHRPIDMTDTAFNGYVSATNFCGWISGVLAAPVQPGRPVLRCLFYDKASSLGAPTADDFRIAACSNGSVGSW